MSNIRINTDKVNKIDTDLVVPSTESNLIEIQRDKWGTILNEHTFKTLNNNIRILKEVILEISNNINTIDLETIKSKLDSLETDSSNIKNIIDNSEEGKLNIGISDKKLNLKGNDLLFNNNKLVFDDVAYTNKLNTFTENVNTSKAFSINNQKVIENAENINNVGSDNIKLNLKTTNDGKFNVNGTEFKVGSESNVNVSELLKISIGYVRGGDYVSNFEVNFNNINYKNPPLLFTNIEDNIRQGGEYYYGNSYSISIKDITNRKFTLQINNKSEQDKITLYVYVINNDENKIPIIERLVEDSRN